jgi:hypothetical protein
MIVRLKFPRRQHSAQFVHPMQPSPRTAILAPGFHGSRNMRVFEQGWCDRAARFRPQSIAAPLAELRRLAGTGLHLEHSVIVLLYEGQDGLCGADRDFLWSAFGVPIYEQYLDVNNRLLAMECEAHSGLHVVRGCEHLRLERETCACGNRSPLLPRGPRVHELVDLLA